MKLLSLNLEGVYKGLKDQTFDFSNSIGNVLALIGLNGSGKSQLLELIAEIFSYLERFCRDDFKTRTPLGFAVTVKYEIRPYLDEQDMTTWRIKIDRDGKAHFFIRREDRWDQQHSTQAVLPQYIVGYSSGLNENLNRAFLKNAVQYFDVMTVRSNRRKQLSHILEIEEKEELEQKFLKRFPGIFISDNFDSIKEKDTRIPATVFLDYDCNALLMASLVLLSTDQIDELFPDIIYRYPKRIVIRYDLRNVPIEQDAIDDIKKLIDLVGKSAVKGNCERTSDEIFDRYELDYLAADIDIDFSINGVTERFRERYYGLPIRLFERLYKIQLLGIKNWQGKDKKLLRSDRFFGNVKKPLKSKLPLEVIELKLSDTNGNLVDFNDLSDGEAQLIQTLGAARIFSQDNTLFIFDEPETHLNPAWRTHFHQYLCKSIDHNDGVNKRVQVFLSTHSPFLLSSLRNENVYLFERNDNSITMEPVTGTTYGASFDVLIRQFFGLQSLISQTAVEDIKKHLHGLGLSKEEQKLWIENNVGDSMEKAYLLRKLRD